MIRWSVGDLQLTILPAGTLWLDGGAMFGVVPRPLWSAQRQPDAQNRIEMATNVLLIEDGEQRILVDTGSGVDWDPREIERHRLQSSPAAEWLAPAGLAPEQIDQVVLTHLHFDHAGGAVAYDPRGKAVPAFPNARYVVQRGELELARLDNPKIRAAYRGRDFEPLVAAHRLDLVEGENWLTPQIRLRPAPGHTPHMQIVTVETADATVAFLADLVPTTSHVRPGWIMAYDLEPLVTLDHKTRLLPIAARDNWQLIFEHDAAQPLARLEQQDGRLSVQPVGFSVEA